MDTNGLAQTPDLIAQTGELLARFAKGEAIAGTLYRDRQSTIVIASAVLAVAGELRDIHNVLAGLGDTTGAARTMPSTVNMCVWAVNPNGWYGACGYEAPDDIDDIIAGQATNTPRCPGCGGKIVALRPERVA